MPLLIINTNTVINDLQKTTALASNLISEILGKPESYVMVSINDKQTLMFAGNNEPTAYIQLKSLGLDESKTTEYSATLCSFINKELNIDSARIYIDFTSPDRHLWGWDNKTF